MSNSDRLKKVDIDKVLQTFACSPFLSDGSWNRRADELVVQKDVNRVDLEDSLKSVFLRNL